VKKEVLPGVIWEGKTRSSQRVRPFPQKKCLTKGPRRKDRGRGHAIYYPNKTWGEKKQQGERPMRQGGETDVGGREKEDGAERKKGGNF